MLPVDVGVHQCALVPDQVRLALVLQAQISAEGRVQNYTFQFARIQSQAKLSYEQVNLALCSEPEAVPMALLPMLQAAQAVTSLLREQRACLDTPDRPEYQLEVDEMGLMTGVECLTRGPAQLLVEELMLLMNHLAAEHLAAHQVGLFLSHNGFKSERWPELQQLLAPFFDAPLAASPSYEEFQALLPKIVATDARLPMLLSRHYCRSQLVAEAKPHWGLGLSSYTTVTSPIRRYLDLALHRQLKAIWRGEPVTAVSSVAELAAGHLEQRELERLVTRWLYAQWMAPRVGETFTAEVQHMMPAGCLVHLLGIGCTGFMPLRAWQDSQAKFDSVLMQHHLSFGVLTLGDTVTVKLQRVDTDQRQMAFELQC
jgi:VacB/RNase II family 3'-5' exoribonuclease